jgi:hypothetical protein
MPAEKIVSQVNESNLFAVFSPGLLIFTFVHAALRTNCGTASLWVVMQGLADHLQQRPAWIVFVLFAAYLLGSLVRTLPVALAERLLPPFTVAFPYPAMLQQVRQALEDHAAAACLDVQRLPNLNKGVPPEVYNYWKDALCLGTANGFEYFQSFETRMRFFTGMIWAGLAGLCSSGWIVLRCRMLTQPAAMALFVLAAVILLTFGWNFRRVRRQEARALLLLFIAYQQKPSALAAANED